MFPAVLKTFLQGSGVGVGSRTLESPREASTAWFWLFVGTGITQTGLQILLIGRPPDLPEGLG